MAYHVLLFLHRDNKSNWGLHFCKSKYRFFKALQLSNITDMFVVVLFVHAIAPSSKLRIVICIHE